MMRLGMGQEPAEQRNQGSLGVPGAESLPEVRAPRRGPVYGSRYAVAADHPLVSLAAMDVMRRGGNAADAAIAAAAVNVVTKPHRTHLGGDAFCLVWRKREGTIDCLNAGGLAPLAATPERFAEGIPTHGPLASSVPGLVDAMLEVYKSYATRPLGSLLTAAIELAEDGFPVSERLAGALSLVPSFRDAWSGALRDAFLKGGAPFTEGERLRQPDLAATLRRLVEDEREGFYEGETAERIVKAMAEMGGIITRDDLQQETAVWADPLRSSYRDCDVYEQAPPSQGFIVLETLNILEEFPLASWGLGSADAIHVMVEATKLAFADSRRYLADPLIEAVPMEALLSKEHARRRAAEIDLKSARQPEAASLPGDTTEFVVADENMAIAFIQSIFAPWGSRVLIPGTGIVMNNRLSGFETRAGAANRIAPGKRTVHTLNTFMALRDGRLVCGGGTPGGDFQVQSNVQTLVAVLDWGLDLQSAVDMPRWVLVGETLALEERFPPSVFADLERRGHAIRRLADWDGNIARSQLVAEAADGGWAVASDLRGEGLALGW